MVTPKENDVVLCTVSHIDGASVFLRLDDFPASRGSLMMSEVAAGRIRNLREYVAPGKRIVCKVLRVSGDHVELSLRRVTAKEREMVLESYKKERALLLMLRDIVEHPDRVLAEIRKDYSILEFFEEAQGNPAIFSRYVGKDVVDRVIQVFSNKERKEKLVRKRFVLKSLSDSGVLDIQKILDITGADIRYLGSSVFSLFVSGKDFKEAHQRLELFVKDIEKGAKEKKALFEIVRER